MVLGLARSDASAAALVKAGAAVHRGSPDDPASLRSGAAAADGVIHTAFDHDFSRFAANCEKDRRAIEALGDALVGSDRLLLVTSGVALLAPGRLATEADRLSRDVPMPRVSEAAAEALAARGVRASTIRLPPSTHGAGDHGFVPIVIGISREKGAAAYVGDGSNRWPAVHRLDAAAVYRLALEKGIGGVSYHAVAEEGIPFKGVAAVIGRHLELPVTGLAPKPAAGHFGWFAMFAGIDAPTSSQHTRDVLGWQPTRPGLLADLETAGYFGR